MGPAPLGASPVGNSKVRPPGPVWPVWAAAQCSAAAAYRLAAAFLHGQLPWPAALRAAMVRSNRPKMGVWTHGLAHHAEQVKTFLPTNVAIADAMGRRFRREKERFTVNSRAGRSQLLRWTLDQKKRRPVTGKRIRRRQDMRSAPVGPAGGMGNVSTEQGVSSRGQPVPVHGRAVLRWQCWMAWPQGPRALGGTGCVSHSRVHS